MLQGNVRLIEQVKTLPEPIQLAENIRDGEGPQVPFYQVQITVQFLDYAWKATPHRPLQFLTTQTGYPGDTVEELRAAVWDKLLGDKGIVATFKDLTSIGLCVPIQPKTV